MNKTKRPTAEKAGAILQGVVLGVLLFFALLQLLMIGTDAQVFRYQGF